MRARVAAVLLVALFLQFIGGEIIFRQLNTANVELERAGLLAERLAIAEELTASPDDSARVERLRALWRDRLTFELLPALPGHLATASAEGTADIHALLREARPALNRHDLRLVRAGDALEGAMMFEDGAWLHFRSEDHFAHDELLFHYAASALLLVACVALIAVLFGRMIGRPLQQIVDAAETAGRDERVTVAVHGPREVRQVATAFESLQTRLLAHLRDRVQALAAMSHDLRTPLARLRLNTSIVEDGETRFALQRDVDEIEGFVDSILDYLRGDDAEPQQRADVASIIMTVVDEARDTGVDVEFAGPSRLEMVTRPLKLKRAVRNIVQNAAHHADSTCVRLEVSEAEVIITIDDDGPGIPEKELERVFEPFVRLDQSRSRNTGGAGLGLAIARRLIDRIDGTITLRNRSEGGLGVTITLQRNRRLHAGST